MENAMPESPRKPLFSRTEEERDYNLRIRGILFLDHEIDADVYADFCRNLVHTSEYCLSEKRPI
jgi:hypothetical protein